MSLIGTGHGPARARHARRPDRRGGVLRRSVAILVALMIAVTGAILPQTAAFAAPVGQIVVAAIGSTTKPMPASFDFNVSWSCSGLLSDRCENLRIEVPITLDNPPGAIEDMDLWQTVVNLPSPSAAGFTTSWTRSGTQLLLVLTATNSITAGTTENIGVSIQPHIATGDGVGFTFGHARLISDSFATVVSDAAIPATITAKRLPEVQKDLISLRPDGAGNVTAIYRIWPRIRQAWDPASDTWGTCGPNVSNGNEWDTAIAGTVRLVDQLPPQATFVSATGGSYDAGTHTIVWDDCQQFGQTLLVEVLYPAAATTQDPAYIPLITNTVTRTFTDTSGVERVSVDDASHSNIGIPRSPVVATKCGSSTMLPGTGIAAPGGHCAPFTVSPSYPYSGDRNTHTYTIRVERLIEGDQVTVTDWMPCFTNPVAAGIETYGSAAGCTAPTTAITGLAFAQVTVVGGVTVKPYTELTLYFADGSSQVFDQANPLPSLNPLPSFPAGAVIGFSARLEPNGPNHVNTIAAVTGSVLPGVDRDLVLENDAEVRVENPLTGDLYAPEHTIGRVRVVDGPFGGTNASGGMHLGRQYIRGNFGAANLDPANGLPSYTLVLPPGYEVASGPGGPDIVISGLSTPDSGNAALADPANYDIEIVPEDLATGTPALVRVTPRAGSPAVPAAVDGRWPQIVVVAFLQPTWGVVSGVLPIASYTSVNGGAAGPHIRGCIVSNSWFAGQQFVSGDPIDADADGDGETSTDTGCVSRATADFIVSNVASSLLFKMARPAGTADAWTPAGGVATSRTGGVEYQIRWENAGRPALQDIVLYDVLPHIGDTGMLAGNSGDPRGSEFAPVFGGITWQSATSGVQIQYSASADPCRPEIFPGQGACTNDWTADPADLGGPSQVRAMRIVLSGQWTGGSSFSLRYTMQAPAGIDAGDIAWNSVAGTAYLLGGGSLASAESGSVGYRMPAEVETAKSSPQAAAPVGVGDPIEYLITARNTLSSRANDVRVSDDLTRMLLVAGYNGDATATVGGNPAGALSYDPATGRLHWSGDLDAGETVEIRFTMTATVSTAAAGSRNGVIASVGDDPTNCADGTEPGCSVAVRIVEPGLRLVKTAIGVAEGATLSANAQLTWRYTVTNTGTEPIESLAVTDDQGVAVSCPVSTLGIGQTTVCTGTGSIGAGPRYENIGTATAVGAQSGHPVSGTDPWFALVAPTVALDKYAAAVAEGSTILAGADVTWSYLVRNTSTERLEQLAVTDNRGVVVSCPETALDPGQSMECTGTGNVGTATPYTNTGIVTGRGATTGIAVTASDPWVVLLTMPRPGVEIVKDSAAVPEGSTVGAETLVTWRYTVTNTGEEPLVLVAVTDDRGVIVSCPQNALAAGETMLCTGTGSVGFGPSYTNTGRVDAVGRITAIPISDSDPWTVIVTPYDTGITIDKYAPAVVEGSRVRPNTVVAWEYRVVNAGQEPIEVIAVTDDRGVIVTCAQDDLDPGEWMICTGAGPVGAGPTYRNVGTVTGTTTFTATQVTDDDPWEVEVRELVPGIALVKGALNAIRGDRAPAGFTVDWQYTVVNTGEEAVEALEVLDDQGVVVSCPVDRLEVGETVVCTGSGSIGGGPQYTNVATATGRGTLTGIPVDAQDTWTVGVDVPPAAVRIVKDAVDHSLGDTVAPGTVIDWTYTVVNIGGQPIVALSVVDDRGVSVSCPADRLEVGQAMVCTGSGGVGSAASYTNLGTVTGTPLWAGPPVVDEDPWTTPITAPVTAGTPQLPTTGAGANPLFGFAAAILLGGTLLLFGALVRRRRRTGA